VGVDVTLAVYPLDLACRRSGPLGGRLGLVVDLDGLVVLEHGDLTAVELDEGVDSALAEGLGALLEGDSQAAPILVELDAAALQVDLAADDVAHLEKVAVIHVLDVLGEGVRVDLTVEEVEHPVFLLLVLPDRVLVQVEVVAAEADADLGAADDGPRCHHAGVAIGNIEVALDAQLKVVAIAQVVVVLDGVVAHRLPAVVPMLVVREQ